MYVVLGSSGRSSSSGDVWGTTGPFTSMVVNTYLYKHILFIMELVYQWAQPKMGLPWVDLHLGDLVLIQGTR